MTNLTLRQALQLIQVISSFEVEDDINTLGKQLLRINDIASKLLLEVSND